MKIGDVKVGTRYAATDEPTGRTYGWSDSRLPREVEVLEIVTVEEPNYTQSWTGSGNERVMRKVRRVKVKVLGGVPASGAWSSKQIANAKVGDVIVVEAKLLVAEWKELRGDITKAVELKERREEQSEKLEARLKALALKESHSSVTVSGGTLRPSLSIYGKDVEKLLTLAEEGKGWRDLGKTLSKVYPGSDTVVPS